MREGERRDKVSTDRMESTLLRCIEDEESDGYRENRLLDERRWEKGEERDRGDIDYSKHTILLNHSFLYTTMAAWGMLPFFFMHYRLNFDR